ncbi:Uncharacterised protein [Escherichia coli]|uniref:Uncharacterized protein n=1 Tax=Escherichia coli TaxID=562 RepID=A0A377KEL1_ECOLX|nr:Uncharacterised protein [Escherichia coli]
MHILDSLLAFSAYFFYWRGDGDYFPVYLLQNYTAQRMAVNQKQ